jgi:phosphinothricin acetyltransferase
VLIRHANPVRDAAACAAIYEPFVLDTAVSFEERPPDEREFARRIERGAQTHPWLVAERDGALAGFAYASSHRSRAAYRWAADVAVYVAADQRRSGVGRALYEALLPLLARQGLYVACAGITLPNDASVALHEAVGFTPVGVYRRIGFKCGQWHDVGWWQVELAPAGGPPPALPGPPAMLSAGPAMPSPAE